MLWYYYINNCKSIADWTTKAICGREIHQAEGLVGDAQPTFSHNEKMCNPQPVGECLQEVAGQMEISYTKES